MSTSRSKNVAPRTARRLFESLESRVLMAVDVLRADNLSAVVSAAGGNAIVTRLESGEDWMGEAPGAISTAAASAAVIAPTALGGYQIDIRFPDGTLSPTQQAVFAAAADRWEQVLTGDLPDVNFGGGDVVDDLRIDATAPYIDGAGRILGQAGPSYIRNGSYLPITGVMQFDSADVAALEANGQLDEVILHEMGHVLGVGTIWGNKNLVGGAGGADPRYTGARAVAEYQAIFGVSTAGVPVENTGGPGTADSHWREAGGVGNAFDNEIMTGFLNGGRANPLSRVTIGQFVDLGYPGVNSNGFDAYVPPGGGNAAPAVGSLSGSAAAVASDSSFTLTADTVTDANGSVGGVKFYRESNGMAGLQVLGSAGDMAGDLLVATDNAAGPFSATVSTAGLSDGTYTYYAQAVDNLNAHSFSVSTTQSIVAPPADTTAPRVMAVYADSTAWTAAARNLLQSSGQGSSSLGMLLPSGQAQLSALPQSNINRFRIQFSENVSVDAADLAVRGVNLANYNFATGVAGFSYDASAFTATWTFAGNVGRDKIMLDLNGEAAGGGVTDGTNLLDGDWVNGAGGVFPSGNNAAAGDFRFQINMLPGDANGSGTVDVSDLGVLSTNFNKSPRGPRQGDFNGDAIVNVSDLGVLSTNFNKGLPVGTPSASALATSSSLLSKPSATASLFGTRPIKTGSAVKARDALFA